MKTFLILLLFYPLASLCQPTMSMIANGASTNGVASTNGATLTEGKLYILFSATSNSGGTPATTSVSGTGQTWTEIGTAGGALNSTSGKRIQAFRFAPSSTNTNSINYSYTGTQDGGWIVLMEVVGSDNGGTNGSNAIVQSPTATDNATQHPSITMSALVSRASVLTGWVNDVNLPGGTAESGWIETHEIGYNNPATGGYIMDRSNTTDNTPSWSAAGFSNWAGIAIEIKAAGRRIFNTQ